MGKKSIQMLGHSMMPNVMPALQTYRGVLRSASEFAS